MISIEQKQIIQKKLQERIPRFECPMCHKQNFMILDGYLTDTPQDDYRSITIGRGEVFPTVAIVCVNCGYVARFALGALGLLPENHEQSSGNQGEQKPPIMPA